MFEGRAVPEVLLSGNHGAIDKWRREQSLKRTWQRRPDLLAVARQNQALSEADEAFLRGFTVAGDTEESVDEVASVVGAGDGTVTTRNNL